LSIELQDGSGTASAFGSGKILAAQVVPRPDKIGMMQKMAKMDMKMGLMHLNIVRKR
jgi:hypothetical protein